SRPISTCRPSRTRRRGTSPRSSSPSGTRSRRRSRTRWPPSGSVRPTRRARPTTSRVASSAPSSPRSDQRMTATTDVLPDSRPEPPGARQRRSRPSTPAHRRHESLTFYLCVSPSVSCFVAFLLGPMLFSISLSFTQWDSFTAPVWVGLDNYITLFTDDPIFLKVMWNTAYYSLLSVPLGMVASLFIANLLNKQVRFRKLF